MSIFSRLFGKKSNLTVDSYIKKQDGRGRNIAFVDTEVGLIQRRKTIRYTTSELYVMTVPPFTKHPRRH